MIRQYGDSKRRRFLIAADPKEERILRQAARLAGLPLAVYIRMVAVERAAVDVERKKKGNRA